MDSIKIAEGGAWDLTHLGDYEEYLAEGDEGYLDLHLRSVPDSWAVSALESALRAGGVALTRGLQIIPGGSCYLRISFRKGAWPLVPIAAVLLASAAAIVMLMIGWALYRVVSSVPSTLFSWQMVLVVALVVAGVVVVTVLVARKGRASAGPVQIGK